MGRVAVLVRSLPLLAFFLVQPLTGCIETKSVVRPSSDDSTKGDDTADVPIPVGGTYLCLIDEKNEIPRTVPGAVPVGCALSDAVRSNKKIVLGPELAYQMTIMTPFNEVIPGVEVHEAPESSPYNWFVYIPEDKVDGALSQVRIIRKDTGEERKASSRIIMLSNPSITLDRPTVVIGQDFDFHLGDTVDVANSSQAQINKKCPIGYERKDQPLKYSGYRISLDFEVPDKDTRVGLSFEDICDSGSMLNTIVVKDSNNQYAAQDFIGLGSTSFLLSSLQHPADATGSIRYTLMIDAGLNKDSGDYDDFIMGKITITSSKPVKVFEDSYVATQRQPSAEGTYERDSVKSLISGAPSGATKIDEFKVTVKGSKVTHFKYKVVPTTSACSAPMDYSDPVDVNSGITVNMRKFVDGMYHLCVLGRDDESYWQPLTSATTAQWRRDTKAEPPMLNNAPTAMSPDLALNVTVGGTDTTSYKFKVGAESATDCTQEAGYSAEWIPVATKITSALDGIPDGSVRLCVVSLDALGNTQPFASATSVTWMKTPPTPPPAE